MNKSLSWLDIRLFGVALPFPEVPTKPLFHPQIGYYTPASQLSKARNSSLLWSSVKLISLFGVNSFGLLQGYFSALRLRKAYQWITHNPLDFNQIRQSNEIIPLFLSPGTASFLTAIYPDMLRTCASVTHAFSLRGCADFFYDTAVLVVLLATGFFTYHKS